MSLGLLHHLLVCDPCRRRPNTQTQTPTSPSVLVTRCRYGPVLRTGVLLQDPTLQLDDGVSEGAAVFPLAAISDLVAADIELAEGVERSDLTVADVGGPHHVHQAPGKTCEDMCLLHGTMTLQF